MVAVGDYPADAFQPRPLPAVRYLERYLIVYTDGLALAALLIVRPIGSLDEGFKRKRYCRIHGI